MLCKKQNRQWTYLNECILLIKHNFHKPLGTHLKMRVDSTPEMLYKKQNRQWTYLNECILLIKHNFHALTSDVIYGFPLCIFAKRIDLEERVIKKRKS